ncbi:MAG: hypothetical protein H6589_11040 [Flavobacteriales bacterium]|nr:hypothetical protein [Flavobacteriales bacterium]
MAGVEKTGFGEKEALVGKTNNHKGGYWGIRGSNNGCISYIIIGLVVIGLFLIMYFL